jgi:hypothetical protein
MNNQNISNFDHWFIELNKRATYNCIRIISKGNTFYILKENNETYFLLLVPARPLEEPASTEIVNRGFQEKHLKKNYTKTLRINNEVVLEQIKEEIEYIFHHLLKVEKERQWRFEIQSGMKILKDPRPLLTKSELRNRNKRKLRIKYNWISIDLLISVPLGILIGLGFISEHKIIIFNNILTIIIPCIILFALFKTISLLQKRGKNYNAKRLFSKGKLDFFLIKGFERKGQRFTGKIKGFKTDIYYNSLGLTEVAVIHEEIPWEKVITISHNSKKIFQNKMINLGQYNSKIKFKTRNSERILKETEEFIDTLIGQGHNPKK